MLETTVEPSVDGMQIIQCDHASSKYFQVYRGPDLAFFGSYFEHCFATRRS